MQRLADLLDQVACAYQPPAKRPHKKSWSDTRPTVAAAGGRSAAPRRLARRTLDALHDPGLQVFLPSVHRARPDAMLAQAS